MRRGWFRSAIRTVSGTTGGGWSECGVDDGIEHGLVRVCAHVCLSECMQLKYGFGPGGNLR